MKKNVRNKGMGLVKWFLPFYLLTFLPLSMMAQDDDLYFVAKKKKASKVEQVKEYAPVVAPQPKAKSSYEVIDGDTTKLDVIDFAEVKGVYPSDTLETEDYALTKKMMRFDDYDVSNNAAFWAGYNAGRSTWLTWHSPWYYSRYGLYEPWYNSYWYNYYSPWYYSWYDPWYYGWYDPYYSSWGWPYYGYYSWYSPYWHGGYYHDYYYPIYGGGGGHHTAYRGTGNAGTIDIKGNTGYHPTHRNTVTTNSQRMGSLRDRASSMGGGRVYTSGNNERSRSGNFSGYRGGNRGGSSASSNSSGRTVYSNHSGGSSNRSSNGSFSSSSSRSSSSSSSSGSFGGSRSSGSSGGGFSGGGSRGGTGGGSHMGGRR